MKEAHPEEPAGLLTETVASAAAQNVWAALPVYPGMVVRLVQIRGKKNVSESVSHCCDHCHIFVIVM